MNHILLNVNDYIDSWLNPQLVHHLYLKSTEGQFFMIDYEKLSCKIFFFLIIIEPQVATLVGAMDFYPLRGFSPRKNDIVMIFDLVL
jgi:hypothetical protein